MCTKYKISEKEKLRKTRRLTETSMLKEIRLG